MRAENGGTRSGCRGASARRGKIAQSMLDNIDAWAAPQRVKHTEMLSGKSEVRASPKGVVLLIAPWNYPVTLVFRPLAAVIAAGNCCVIKPSEVSSHSAKPVLKLLFPRAVGARAPRGVARCLRCFSRTAREIGAA